MVPDGLNMTGHAEGECLWQGSIGSVPGPRRCLKAEASKAAGKAGTAIRAGQGRAVFQDRE